MCDLTSLKGAELSVRVDEALPDIIVVSYVHDAKVFRGVLLDATKRHLPCGIAQLNPAFDAGKPDEDVLYSVKQRFAYADPNYTHISASTGPQPTRSLKNNKIGKMTVRLRPRQVLCSKCKDICAENSDSITRKRKAIDAEAPLTVQSAAVAATPPTPAATSPAKRSANAPVTRSAQLKNQQGALSGIVNKLNIVNNTKALSPSNQNASAPGLKRVTSTRRKAAPIGEKDKEPETASSGLSNISNSYITNASNTRTIKICYGPQREGTVLKIPAPIETMDVEDDDVPEENVAKDEIASKATRKAMKKAKKAKKKITFQTIGSPEPSTSRYALGSSSPRYTVGSASPRHGLGNNSPRFVATLPPIPLAAFEPLPKKRKHKMKHKKKHKEDRQERDRKHKDDHDGKGDERDEKDKEKCLTQKLSINLKRLSGTYTTSIVADATSTTSNASEPDCEERCAETSDDSSEDVPDFPPGPLRLKLTAKHLGAALSAEGGQLIVGDVVWGKIQGFPWWPGKILTITNGDHGPRPQAHVSWYGSSTSSLIQCESLSLYLANFKARYNRKKRGPYKEAIKQATNEARVLAELRSAETATSPSSTTASAAASTSASPSRMIMLVQPALASPREINVIS